VWRRLVERLAAAAGLPLMPGRCSNAVVPVSVGAAVVRDQFVFLSLRIGLQANVISWLGLVLFDEIHKIRARFSSFWKTRLRYPQGAVKLAADC
jgi:hypothetical protein